MASRRWLYFGGFVITTVLLVGASLLGILEGLSAFSTGVPTNEEFILLELLGAAAEWVVAVLALGIVALLFLTATVVSVLRTASLPRNDRLVSIVERVERRYPALRRFGAAQRFQPTMEDRQQRLREQYVQGEISEAEFEREMAQIMDETPDEPPQSATEKNVELDDDPR
jgi:membrane protein implicated in regulation of membrane protease activity